MSEGGQIAQEIFENRDLRALFDASRNATPEDLKIVRDLLTKNKKRPGFPRISPGAFLFWPQNPSLTVGVIKN